MRIGFEHSYASLPSHFFVRVPPTPVTDPKLVIFNRPLAEQLGLDAAAIEPRAAALFSGNEVAEDSLPIAMAYAGHQFGNFVPQLGDGRAILLGELKDRDGVLRDVQLKGSGRTPFSRSGDGRATLGPMLREYIISEAMHALGIPTTRSLAVVTTGEPVFREQPLPGAVLTRVAASHIRVGTFEYFAARRDTDAIRELLNYVITRHYPEARDAEVPALAVIEAVSERQAKLIADWMGVGFIHGVMNTDNMAISGETIDYGPCAFMDSYDPKTVFSSIDRNGRYAYVNQPGIAQWNLARFAETLLPLIDSDEDQAVARATEALHAFMGRFDVHFLQRMRNKIGLSAEEAGDTELIKRLFAAMQAGQADFTMTFRRLADVAEHPDRRNQRCELVTESQEIETWLQDWDARLKRDPKTAAERAANMRRVNPEFIPRNHRVQAALDTAVESGDLEPFRRLLTILQRPYDHQPEAAEFALPPPPSELPFQTFCGT
jgi:serine/tyrosine/threonine adenylyltransferase